MKVPLHYSTTPLLAAGESASGWARVSAHPLATDTAIPIPNFLAREVKGGVFADQAGTLFVEQSNDGGVTVHHQWSAPVAAGLAGALSFARPLTLMFVRVRYLNGGVGQGAFNFLAYLES